MRGLSTWKLATWEFYVLACVASCPNLWMACPSSLLGRRFHYFFPASCTIRAWIPLFLGALWRFVRLQLKGKSMLYTVRTLARKDTAAFAGLNHSCYPGR